MERLSKEDLLAKWKSNRDKLYSELHFCIDHKFSLEQESIRRRIDLLGDFIFDLEYVLKDTEDEQNEKEH